jgi:hypothetical protein
MATSNRTKLVNSGYTILNGISSGKNDDRFDVWVEYKVTSQSVANNTSSISAYFYSALKSGESSTTRGSNGLDSTFSVGGKSGTAKSNASYDFRSPDTINLLGSYSGTITHDADGSKTITIKGSFTTESDYIAGGSISKQVSLPTIARASVPTVSASTPKLGTAFTIKINRASNSFTHKVSYSYKTESGANKNGTIATSVGSSCEWTPPYSIAADIPTKTKVDCTITCVTYSESNEIGTKTVNITLNVPDNETTKPNVAVTLTPYHTGTAAEDDPVMYYGSNQENASTRLVSLKGCYVKAKSKVKAAITAVSQYSSGITKYELIIGNKTTESTSRTIISSALVSAGSVDVRVRVTDARGYSSEITRTIRVLEHSAPKLEDVSVYRCTADGTPADEGSFVYVRATRSYEKMSGKNQLEGSPITQGNLSPMRVRYKTSSDDSYGSWIYVIPAANIGTDVYDSVLKTSDGTPVEFDNKTSYALQVNTFDVFGNGSSSTVTFPVPTAQTDFNLNNKKAAFGKYAEVENAVEIADDWNIVLRGEPITSHVIRVWEKDGITYRLWDDGRFDFWGEVSATPTTGTATSLDGIYYTNSIPVTLDVAFKTCCFSAMPTGSYAWTVNCAISSTANRQIGFRLMRINKNIADTTYTVRLVGNGTT